VRSSSRARPIASRSLAVYLRCSRMRYALAQSTCSPCALSQSVFSRERRRGYEPARPVTIPRDSAPSVRRQVGAIPAERCRPCRRIALIVVVDEPDRATEQPALGVDIVLTDPLREQRRLAVGSEPAPRRRVISRGSRCKLSVAVVEKLGRVPTGPL
jgi:hypothetical protein